MPLTFDLPLSELPRYPGTNPRPADFDRYWDDALASLDDHDPQVELLPSDTLRASSADCFDLFFRGVGGARVHAKYIRPRRPGPLPALLEFHGYSASSGDWLGKLAWAAEGFCVASLDCRGQGGLSEDVGGVKGNTLRGHIIRGLDDPDPTRLLYRQIFLDTALLARIVMGFPEVDSARVGAMGGSQGGALALACAALEPRIARAAPVFPFLSDYRRVWQMDQAKDAYEELRQFFRLFDPRHLREEEIFTRLGYIDIQHLAPRIRARVLMFTALMDTICPPSTQFAAYNKILSPKEVVLYPDFGHESLPGQADLAFAFFREMRDGAA
jgi:cephalosporin-C deacetylase